MSILSVSEHAELCAIAESAMVDTCTITRPAAPGTQGDLNKATLKYDTPAAPSTIYTGVCEVDAPPGAASEEEAAAADWATQGLQVKLPIRAAGAKDVRRGDVVTIDSSLSNPALVGRKITVDGISDGTWSTRRRLACKEGV